MSATLNPPPSPSVASRRAGGKAPPKLPLSVFAQAAGPNPLTSDPTSVFPKAIVDANVALDLPTWKSQSGDLLTKSQSDVSVVLSLHTSKDQPPLTEERLDEILHTSSGVRVVAVIAPTHLADRGISKLPAHITSSPSPFAFSISFAKRSTSVDDIKLILSAGHVVDIDVPWSTQQAESEEEWDVLEETLGQAVAGAAEHGASQAIVLSNLLPPPHSLAVSIVKLLTHPTYLAYQSHISSLSFIPNVYLKFLPPSWQDPTPPSPAPGATFADEPKALSDQMAKEEWKRRVKMYLGPALDAFGISRLIFGTSPSPSSSSSSTPHDWYVLAREVIAELGVDQDGVDAIFGGNALRVYGQMEE